MYYFKQRILTALSTSRLEASSSALPDDELVEAVSVLSRMSGSIAGLATLIGGSGCSVEALPTGPLRGSVRTR